MDFFDVVQSRRSVRNYQPDTVPRADLERIVAAGIEAPSGVNMQLRHYVIVDDPAPMEELRLVSKALTGAPAAVVLLIEPKASPYGEFYVQDASAAMENMLLAATALGYGSCWVEGAVRRRAAQIAELLSVPEYLQVWSLLPVGKPAGPTKRPEKSRFEDAVHVNRFGNRCELGG